MSNNDTEEAIKTVGFNFDWNMLWEVAGPFIISAIVALVIAIIFVVIMVLIPSRFGRQLISILAIFFVVVGFMVALHITSGIWGNI